MVDQTFIEQKHLFNEKRTDAIAAMLTSGGAAIVVCKPTVNAFRGSMSLLLNHTTKQTRISQLA